MLLLLLLLSLCSSSWQVTNSNGTFRFLTSASGPHRVCKNNNAKFHCIVTLVLDNGSAILQDAVWKKNGIKLFPGTPGHSFIRSSKSPRRIIGVEVIKVQLSDNGTVYTCTAEQSPTDFTSNATLNVTGSGCKKSDELQTAATIIGIVTFVAFAAIFIVVAFILLFKLGLLPKCKARRGRYHRLHSGDAGTQRDDNDDVATQDSQNDAELAKNSETESTCSQNSESASLQASERIGETVGSSTTFQPQLNRLQLMFSSQFSEIQIFAIFNLTNHEIYKAIECLSSGPTLEKMMKLILEKSKNLKTKFVDIREHNAFSKLLSFYKSFRVDISSCQTVIRLNKQMPTDVRSLRHQIYTRVLEQCAENKRDHYFDGPNAHLQPHFSAKTASSRVFKALGRMVGHSIVQNGIGFPYFSSLCYWYIAGNESIAAKFISEVHVDIDCCDDVKNVGAKVYQVPSTLRQQEEFQKIKILLDQFKEGLNQTGLLNLVQSFPDQFAPLFMLTREIDADEIKRSLCFENVNENEAVIEFLQQYIKSLSPEKLKHLMVSITGGFIVPEEKVIVKFATDNINVVKVSPHFREIYFPVGAFKENDYGKFKKVMDAVVYDIGYIHV